MLSSYQHRHDILVAKRILKTRMILWPPKILSPVLDLKFGQQMCPQKEINITRHIESKNNFSAFLSHKFLSLTKYLSFTKKILVGPFLKLAELRPAWR